MSDPDSEATREHARREGTGATTHESATDRPGRLPAVRRAVARLDERAAALRSEDALRRGLLVVGVVAGLALAWVHWVGLVAGGAFVGVTRRSLSRAVLAGLGFGALSLLATALSPWTVGVGAVAILAPVSYLGIVLGFALPAWGALVRGVL